VAPVRAAEVGVIGAIVSALVLWWNTLQMPDVKPGFATPMVLSAIRHATPRVPAGLIIGLGWAESRFEPTAQPACGVMQVYPHDLGLDDATTCAAVYRDVDAGVALGVLEIETMLADRRVNGDLRVALLYRACGNRAFVPGACAMGGWVDKALARAKILESTPRLSS
jgi:hypothetical protein